MSATPSTVTATSPVGPVSLIVSNLDQSLRYYEDGIGLKVLRRGDGTADLGAGAEDLLHLQERPGAVQPRRTTGLYHFALLVPTRHDLAQQLRHFADAAVPLQGASDHLVSEAIYLADPDGNGIEVYSDRPRERRSYDGGQVRMATDGMETTIVVVMKNLLSEVFMPARNMWWAQTRNEKSPRKIMAPMKVL